MNITAINPVSSLSGNLTLSTTQVNYKGYAQAGDSTSSRVNLYTWMNEVVNRLNNKSTGTCTVASQAASLTINETCGQISVASADAGAAGATPDVITLTNRHILATSIVQVTIGGYSGTLATNGLPVAIITAIVAGTLTITIYNAHATNALSGTVLLNFWIQ